LINHKAAARIRRERQLQVRPLRRFVRPTDSDHDHPVFPNLAADFTPPAAHQLWVANLTYVAVAVGLVSVAVIRDAWSRRVVGYAIARRIDTRLTLAAWHAAFAARRPPPGWIHHADRDGQYAAALDRDTLAALGLRASMGRRGNPYDNTKAESFMKTLKCEHVYRND
jgi:putative transposase